jgi:amino acid adenylation domain-containing protein
MEVSPYHKHADRPSDWARVDQLVQAAAVSRPTAVAVEYQGKVLTYGALMATADELAVRLQAAGVGADDRVAICLERGFAMVTAVLAVLRAGGAYVPLDPAYPQDLLGLMLKDAGATVLLTQTSLADRLPDTGATRMLIDGMAESRPPAAAAAPSSGGISGDSLAYVIYTSGSTGVPKGVAMPHRALTNLLRWQRRVLPIEPGERTLQFTSLSFDASFQEIFTIWAEGGTLVLVDEETRRDPVALWEYLVAHRITRLYLPFVALQQLAEAAELSTAVPSGLRDVITAGEQLQCTPRIQALFRKLPVGRLHNFYGPSETHGVTLYTLSPEVADWPVLPPIGRPIDGVVCWLLDERQAPVAPGEPGELFLGGECLARGYLGRADLTAERFLFLCDAEGAEIRLYRTGDLCRDLGDGTLEFLGRTDSQVKIRGYRIEPGAVEAALKRHTGVQDAVVTAHATGDAPKRLIGYVVPREGSVLTGDELRAFLLQSLAEYMVPSQFLLLDHMPLTPSGKVDRRSLPEPGVDRSLPRVGLVPLEGATEAAIGAIWCELLDLQSVGATESFFSLGGTSLMLTRLRLRLRESLGRDVPATALYQFPTVRALAAHLDGASASAPALSESALGRAALQRQVLAKMGRPAGLPPKPPAVPRHG